MIPKFGEPSNSPSIYVFLIESCLQELMVKLL